jgi:hypothetical protein
MGITCNNNGICNMNEKEDDFSYNYYIKKKYV